MSQVVRRFRLALEAHDSDAAIEALADDVVFRSPVVFKPYRGRAEVKPILRGARAGRSHEGAACLR